MCSSIFGSSICNLISKFHDFIQHFLSSCGPWKRVQSKGIGRVFGLVLIPICESGALGWLVSWTCVCRFNIFSRAKIKTVSSSACCLTCSPNTNNTTSHTHKLTTLANPAHYFLMLPLSHIRTSANLNTLPMTYNCALFYGPQLLLLF